MTTMMKFFENIQIGLNHYSTADYLLLLLLASWIVFIIYKHNKKQRFTALKPVATLLVTLLYGASFGFILYKALTGNFFLAFLMLFCCQLRDFRDFIGNLYKKYDKLVDEKV